MSDLLMRIAKRFTKRTVEKEKGLLTCLAKKKIRSRAMGTLRCQLPYLMDGNCILLALDSDE